MRLLLDTHALLWWLDDHQALSAAARELIADAGNEVLVSVVSLWEIVVKQRIGKLDADIHAIIGHLDAQGFALLPIEAPHLFALSSLPVLHRDPFDHLLLAQALAEGATLISADRHMAQYGVRVLGG